MGHMAAANTQGVPSLFFGLGSGRTGVDFEIRWPSGMVSTERVETAGTYTFVEPDWVQIEPFGRVLPADGESVGTVRISPSLEGASVGLRRYGEEGLVDLSLELEGGSYVYQWTAGQEAITHTFEIVIDGTALGILPRVHEVVNP